MGKLTTVSRGFPVKHALVSVTLYGTLGIGLYHTHSVQPPIRATEPYQGDRAARALVVCGTVSIFAIIIDTL